MVIRLLFFSLYYLILGTFSTFSTANTIFVDGSFLASPNKAISARVKVFDKEDIERKNAKSLKQLFVGESLGLSFIENGVDGVGSIFFRGVNSSHVLVVLDGLVLNDPSDPSGRFDFSQIDLLGIEQVEVFRGSASSLFGSGAIGGVIYLHSGESLKSEIELGLGSFGRGSLGIRGAFLSDGKHYFSVGASQQKRKGLSNRGGSSSLLEPDPFLRESLFVKWSKNFGKKKYSFLFKRDTKDLEVDSFSSEDLDDYVFETHDKHILRFETNRLSLGLSYRDSGRRSFSSGATSKFGAEELSLQILKNFGDHKVSQSLLGDLRVSKAKFERSFESEQRTGQSLAYQAILLSSHREFSWGARLDRSKVVNKEKINRSLSLQYKQLGRGEWGFGASNGFKEPSMYQMFSRDYGNQSLRTEVSRHFETWKDFEIDDKQKVELNLFRTDLNDLIDTVAAGIGYAYENIQEARVDGFEVSTKRDLTKGYSIFTGVGFYSSLDRKTKARLLARPDSIYNLSLEKNWKATSVVFSLDRIGSRIAYGGGGLDSYLLANLDLKTQFKGFELDISIQNLLNQNYNESSNFTTYPRGIFVELSREL